MEDTPILQPRQEQKSPDLSALLPHHLTQLRDESGISPEIIAARGYRSLEPEFAVYRHLRTRNPWIDGAYLPKRLQIHRYMN